MLIWEAAEHNAQIVRDTLRGRGIPFSLEAVCDVLEIDVMYTPDLEEQGISGMIVKRKHERPKVYVNAQDSPNRQRFTLAHEVGHFVERMTEAKDREFSFTDRRGGGYDLHEFYADQFAGALLMPKDSVAEISPSFDYRDALSVSLNFDVSFSAASKRLERLRKQKEITSRIA